MRLWRDILWAKLRNDNKQKIKSLIKGYESVKKISSREKGAINVLCRGAALRYLLTRLYDYSNTPKTALIKIKNPNEYYQKLLTHNSLNSYKDYLPRWLKFIQMVLAWLIK